jgi:DNA-binding MarR family transcriptional regulator
MVFGQGKQRQHACLVAKLSFALPPAHPRTQSMISPALNEASTDTKLRGADFRLLGYLHGQLIPGEYRKLKLWVIAQSMHMNKATASRALKKLVKHGYLREGPRQEDGVRCYMVVPVRGEPAKKTA